MTDRTNCNLRLLGAPVVTVGDVVVEFPTRKCRALFVYLALRSPERVDRRQLSALLWGNSGDELARASMRKCLSVLCQVERIGHLVERDRNAVWIRPGHVQIDLDRVRHLVSLATRSALEEALTLWRGQPLAGLDLNEPLFDEWAHRTQDDLTNAITSTLHRQLSGLPDEPTSLADNEIVAALCKLMVRIEPADAMANERLIEVLARGPNPHEAVKQYRAYRLALADLDVAMPGHMRRLAANVTVEMNARANARKPNLPDAANLTTRPQVVVETRGGSRAVPDLFSAAHSQLMHQLAKFRTMNAVERADAGPTTSVTRVTFADAPASGYHMLLVDEPAVGAVFLRCRSLRTRAVISSTRLDYGDLRDAAATERAIAGAINQLEQTIIAQEAVVGGEKTVWGRWLEAYRLLTQWDQTAEKEAFDILKELAEDRDGRRLSLVHSAIASILMIRRLTRPDLATVADDHLRYVQDRAHRALVLDDREPFNHVTMGWAAMQGGQHDAGLVSFQRALHLNPYSSRTLISAAEAHAYAGRQDEAQRLARKAIDLGGDTLPAYFHTFLANIAYLSNDLNGCLEHLRLATDNLHTMLLRIAVHGERGDLREVASARAQFERALRRSEPRRHPSAEMVGNWIVKSNMVRSPHTRQRLFSTLENAGVPVARPA